jgi:TRAP-type C4-dicarboxylate transport system permease small subunit
LILPVKHLPQPLRRPVQVMLAMKRAFVCTASLIMAFTFLFVVILRYGFRADLFAYEEWLLIICFWLYFIASALGTFEDSHVNADLLDHFIVNARLKWIRILVVATIELVVSLAVIYWAVLMIQDEIASHPYWQATIALKIPFLVPRLAVLVGFVFMAFYTSLRIYVLLKLGPAGPYSEPTDNTADGDLTSRAA